MLSKVRHHLWLVGYYSATRKRHAWSRWVERALFASIVVAPAAMLAMESFVTRSATTETVSGRLAVTEDSVTLAELDTGRAAGFGDASLVGEWTIEVTRSERGWPFPSIRRHERPRLDLNRYERPGLEIDAVLGADDPIRAAIQHALARGDRHELVADWQIDRADQAGRYWLGAVAGTLAWWVGLSVVSVVVIRVLALRSHLRRAKKADRATTRKSEGRCRGCNYDLRGLEFSARCPECGKLV